MTVDFATLLADTARPPDSSVLDLLADELELPGTKGSRMLDGKVALTIRWHGLFEIVNGKNAFEWVEDNPNASYEDVATHWSVPEFTTDFEGACASLPDDWRLASLRLHVEGVGCEAVLDNLDAEEITAGAASYALAIVAAGVFARRED